MREASEITGWKLVPIKPTVAMLAAVQTGPFNGYWSKECKRMWQLMVEAAPPALHRVAVEPQSIVRHIKTGGLYEVMGPATLEATGEAVTVYRGLTDGKVWVRNAAQMLDGRFALEAERKASPQTSDAEPAFDLQVRETLKQAEGQASIVMCRGDYLAKVCRAALASVGALDAGSARS